MWINQHGDQVRQVQVQVLLHKFIALVGSRRCVCFIHYYDVMTATWLDCICPFTRCLWWLAQSHAYAFVLVCTIPLRCDARKLDCYFVFRFLTAINAKCADVPWTRRKCRKPADTPAAAAALAPVDEEEEEGEQKTQDAKKKLWTKEDHHRRRRRRRNKQFALNVNVSRSLPVHLIRRVLRVFAHSLIPKHFYKIFFENFAIWTRSSGRRKSSKFWFYKLTANRMRLI